MTSFFFYPAHLTHIPSVIMFFVRKKFKFIPARGYCTLTIFNSKKLSLQQNDITSLQAIQTAIRGRYGQKSLYFDGENEETNFEETNGTSFRAFSFFLFFFFFLTLADYAKEDFSLSSGWCASLCNLYPIRKSIEKSSRHFWDRDRDKKDTWRQWQCFYKRKAFDIQQARGDSSFLCFLFNSRGL